MTRARNRGYTLFEIVVVAMVVLALAALSLGGFAGQRERATTESMARVVAAELEAARTRALKNGYPVAVCFPSENGSTPTTQTFYILEGEVKPRVTRVRSLAGDFPESTIANVYWGSAALVSDSAGLSRSRMLSSWLGNKVGKDFALIFLPDGTVFSNDLPRTDGSYQLLVSAGVNASSSNVSGSRLFSPSPNHFRLNSAFAPQSILVSGAGRVQVVPGVLDGAGVSILPAEPGTGPSIANVVIPTKEADSTPVLDSVVVAPAPFLEPKATVQKERNLSLVVSADDADGDQLFCTWEATAQGGAPGTGYFSLPDKHPMVWDREVEKWVSNCTWAPPAQCNVGDQYTLECKIVDEDGNEILANETILDPVTIIPPGKLVIDKTSAPKSVVSVNTDGTDLQTLTTTGSGSAVSPDGRKLAWINDEDGGYNQIWIMNLDGTGKKQMVDLGGSKGSLYWSGDGTHLLFIILTLPGRDTIWSVKADGTDYGNIYTGPGSSCYSPVFSPDGELVVYRAYRSAPGVRQVSPDLGVAEFVRSTTGGSRATFIDQSMVTDNSATRTSESFVCWIPGTSREFIYTTATPGPSGNFSDAIRETHRARIEDSGSGSTRFRIDILDTKAGTTVNIKPIFSPDGSQVVYGSGGRIYVADWADRGDASLNISNARQLSTPIGGNVTVKAWIP
jgi:Tol biopolymer transport system component/type II secretory pathway pseudopilin PulG